MTTHQHDRAEKSSNTIERSDPQNMRVIVGLVLAIAAGVGIKSCIDADKHQEERARLEWQLYVSRCNLREKSEQIRASQRAENIRLLKNQILTLWDMARVNIGFLINQNARLAEPCHVGVLTMDTVPDLNRAAINFRASDNPNRLIHNTRANLHGAIVSLHHVIRQATDLANPTFDSCPTDRCPTPTEKKWAEDVANLAQAYLQQLLPIYARACTSGGCVSVDLPRNVPPRRVLSENEWLFQNQ